MPIGANKNKRSNILLYFQEMKPCWSSANLNHTLKYWVFCISSADSQSGLNCPYPHTYTFLVYAV